MASVIVTLNPEMNVTGSQVKRTGTITFPDAQDGGYTLGGTSIDPSQFGYGVLDAIDLELGVDPANPSLAIQANIKTALPIKGSWNPLLPQALIQAFWTGAGTDPFKEVADTTDISPYVIKFTAWGVN